ncbi:MAG: alpha/beta fold hydrolase [Candidatus Nanopelagicaceae bacterium]
MFKGVKLKISKRKIAIFSALFILVASISIFNSRNDVAIAKIESKVSGAEVMLDTTMYLPKTLPAPTVLIAHGFGGNKNSESQLAEQLARNGFVAFTYSARGFGNSTGLITMNAPDKEIADASKLVDYLSTRKEVAKDKNGSAIIGVTGGSYGGALSLMLAATDDRIKAVSADITWANLNQALFPQNAFGNDGNPVGAGPFKKIWAGTFFSFTALQNSYLGQCGNFAEEWCAAFQSAVTNGAPDSAQIKLMNESSPEKYLANLKAPTLLMQGEEDSLFPLIESLRNAAAISKSDAADKLAMIWHSGGHDGGNSETERLNQATIHWFNKYLKGKSINFPRFQVTDATGTLSVSDSTAIATILQSKSLPTEGKLEKISVNENMGPFFSPIGGVPAALSSLPGLGSAGALASSALASLSAGGAGFGTLSPALLPGQSATFASAPIKGAINIVGSSKIKVRVTSTTNDATLFFSLMAESRSGALRLPGGIVAPVKLTNIPKSGLDAEIHLPAAFIKLAPGEKIVLAVSATDQGYALPNDGRFYTVAPISELEYPTIPLSSVTTSSQYIFWPIMALLTLVIAIFYVRIRRPKISSDVIASDKNLIQISNLSKVYGDGYRAVDDLSFNVGRGQVLGLLGPNGAGKTTTLRMLMGLIMPTDGGIWIDGHPVFPGSSALSKLGSFVEGPGFLPHMTGRENLDLYWRAIGRDVDPKLEEVIKITKLGSALDKKVRSYSQGMRQRLAIAQAMMGLPEILVLDEPTNGLDPQQIAEMRSVLKSYAKGGRTVIISSHLLAEVQQTCSHVVLMHRGKLVATGTLKKILKDSQSLEEIFLELIGDDLIIGKDAK